MDPALEGALAEATNTHARIISSTPVGGGCIHDARRIELDDGRRYFVKQANASGVAAFAAEAFGLARLAEGSRFRIPNVVAHGATPTTSYLALEWIDRAPETARRGFERDFGRRLAAMHTARADRSIGFPIDNHLGATPQPNLTNGCIRWHEFWRRYRLEPQLALAGQQGLGGTELQRLGDRLAAKLDTLLDEPEFPALLHGDLWSGNVFADADGTPVLVDPACYYGHREAEFGMISLFGGVGPEFYAAYAEIAPFADGADDRIAIYRLHHLLNHLNLFGSGYLAQCLALLRRYA